MASAAGDLYFSASANTSAGAMEASIGTSLGSTDDIYNNWLLHNISRATVRVITDYVGASNVFKLNSDIDNQSSTDYFYITKSDWDKVHVYSEKTI